MAKNPPSKIAEILAKFPIVREMAKGKPVIWNNPYLKPLSDAFLEAPFSFADMQEAADRLDRFAPYIAEVFPETEKEGGLIESPLVEIPHMRDALAEAWNIKIPGKLLVKLDSHLPVSGSIKARGGFYEVLAYAERLAFAGGFLQKDTPYTRLNADDVREYFSHYSLAVGSTGNLGLSVGLMGAALGLKTTVHMSKDARGWKKDMLRSKGATVIEYAGDYGAAVKAGRAAAAQDPMCHFVDDENSRNLFLGYAVAGLRVQKQLEQMGIIPTLKKPLLVYLPCGVGGGPGGVSFGLKAAIGDAAHCYFAEPVQAPAVILGLASECYSDISAEDIRLSGSTAADGLAVARPSELVCETMRFMLEGGFTLEDECLFSFLAMMADTENIRLEPSALAGVPGIYHTQNGALTTHAAPEEATHLIWATGGGLVPQEEWESYYQLGKALLKKGIVL